MLKQFLKYQLRNGHLFKRYFLELQETEKYSVSELAFYQNAKLRKTIASAYQNVPYYRRVFDSLKLSPADIRTVGDLQRLPIIDKKTVRDNFKDFRNKNFKGFVYGGYTSGTTGTPGKFLRDLQSINLENAAIALQKKWAGIKKRPKSVWLRGDQIIPAEKNTPPFWKYNRIEKKLIMSSYHLSDELIPFYIDRILSYKPLLIQAYPSTVYVIAKYLKKSNCYLDIPVIQTSSEPLYPLWRELIEERFRGKIFDYYGTAERVCFAAECGQGQGLHVYPSYGVFELVDRKTNEVQTHEGVIVGTTLNNEIMPLIRYKTNDVGKMISGECPCGCKYPRIYPIETKCENIVVTNTGKHISPSLLTFFFKNSGDIKESQIKQRADGSVVIKLVKGPEYKTKDGEDIVKKMHTVLGDDIRVILEYVDSIPRTNNGKYQWVISERCRDSEGLL